MSERDYAPLSIACVRGLCDKLYEKRKFAGGEIEKMVKDFADANNTSQIKRLIRVLGQDLMSSTNPNVKNGALMGLSSVAVGLGKGCEPYTGELLSPIIACLSESESRVRYQAVEALFNVAKIARGAALRHFAAVFDALARLAADPEPQVKQAAELLDRLLKDIVTESSTLEVSWLVGLVRERMYARGAAARQFAVAWLAALDAVPSVRLQRHLPDLLDPLFKMLDDPNPEIRRMCEVQLGEFLRSIRAAPAEADLPAMINILITHAQSTEELVQLTAVTWMWWFLSLAGGSLRRHASGVLSAVLPALAYHDDARSNIRETASNVNQLLLKLVVEGEEAPGERESETEAAAGGEGERDGESAGRGEGEGDGGGEPALGALVGVLTQMLHHNSVHTKVAALEWILRLYGARAAGMAAHTERVWGAVALSVADPSDDVVRRALAVLAEICSAAAPPGALLEASPYYHKFLRALLRLLANDEALLDDRGAFIVRQLCVLLNAEQVYAALARLLADEADLRFAATMVDTLSTILLTAAELHDLRATLRDTTSPAGAALFAALSGCWCHSAVALLALCLLTHNYTHCNRLIATLVIFLIKAISGDLEITVDFLTEVDKLVQLIESPIFAYLRLELLDGSAGSLALRGALYGLLMLLPQSDAFHLLRRRLQCAPPPPPQPLTLPSSQEEPALEALVAEFARVQAAHRRYRMLDRSRHPRHS